jgi:hypothetical protein
MFENNSEFLSASEVTPMLKFFNKTTNISPITNSSPPNPSIKKVKDMLIISLLFAPIITHKENSTNQVSSANSNKDTKL